MECKNIATLRISNLPGVFNETLISHFGLTLMALEVSNTKPAGVCPPQGEPSIVREETTVRYTALVAALGHHAIRLEDLAIEAPNPNNEVCFSDLKMVLSEAGWTHYRCS